MSYNIMAAVVKAMPDSHKDDLRNLLDKALNQPDRNPFYRSMLNSAYYVPRLQKVVDLLAHYQADMERMPYIGEPKK